jgi:hypothetical protein
VTKEEQLYFEKDVETFVDLYVEKTGSFPHPSKPLSLSERADAFGMESLTEDEQCALEAGFKTVNDWIYYTRAI